MRIHPSTTCLSGFFRPRRALRGALSSTAPGGDWRAGFGSHVAQMQTEHLDEKSPVHDSPETALRWLAPRVRRHVGRSDDMRTVL